MLSDYAMVEPDKPFWPVDGGPYKATVRAAPKGAVVKTGDKVLCFPGQKLVVGKDCLYLCRLDSIIASLI